jgi:predicted nucleic acid-binding Zn ribbon protein
MARNNKSKRRRFDWRILIFLILSLMMVVVMVLSFLPPPQ